MEKVDGFSMNLEHENLRKIASLFPEVMVEGRLDLTKLLDLLGEYDIKDFEKYKFEWKGKSECLQLAQRRTTATLRPKPSESVNFDTTNNVYIKGDNLEVLKILQNAYYRQVKMIYIDPPYNTGNDFVYEDDFSDPIAQYKLVTSQTQRTNPETMGRFHTAWLNMMYPRLRLAANLLRDDGICFVSIDDNEVHNLRKICDETFGEENFVCQFVWKRRSGANDAKNNVSLDHEYVLAYGKLRGFSLNGAEKTFENYTNPDNDPRGEWARDNLTCGKTASQRPNLYYPITDPTTGITYQCNPDHVWRFEKSKMEVLIQENKVIFPTNGNGQPCYKRHRAEVRSNTKPFGSMIDTRLNSVATKELREIFQGQIFDYPKTTDLLKQLVNQATNASDNDIVLDFFSGSATTAHAVMQLNAEDGGNRQFIMVQLPEVAEEQSEAYKAGYKTLCDIGMERIRRAGAKILAENEISTAQISIDTDSEAQPLDVGFKVFELDTSNLATWDTTPIPAGDNQLQILDERMNAMLEEVKHDRTDLDMVYEVMLKLAVPLTTTVTPIDVQGKTAYQIREDVLLMICLADDITPEMVEEMCKYAPGNLILGENGVNSATAMSNAHYICKDRKVNLRFV